MQIIDSMFSLFNSLLNHTKKLDLSKLPSQGKFYQDDFELSIKKADLEDIIDYEHNFDKDNIFWIVESLKKVVNYQRKINSMKMRLLNGLKTSEKNEVSCQSCP